MKVRKVGIFTQLFILLAVLLLLGNGILGVFIYNKSKDALFDQIQINAENIASCAAMSVPGDVRAGKKFAEFYVDEEEFYDMFLDVFYNEMT